VLLGAQFLAVIQVVVYAGGIVVLYLFVVMLVNLKRPPEAHQDRRRRGRLGLIVALVVLVELTAISAYKYVSPAAGLPPVTALGPDNVAQVGTMLYTDYLVPFELASILLLVAMVGAIILARREL
jgi:NADH-quinone oxidoreductase subunit J